MLQILNCSLSVWRQAMNDKLESPLMLVALGLTDWRRVLTYEEKLGDFTEVTGTNASSSLVYRILQVIPQIFFSKPGFEPWNFSLADQRSTTAPLRACHINVFRNRRFVTTWRLLSCSPVHFRWCHMAHPKFRVKMECKETHTKLTLCVHCVPTREFGNVNSQSSFELVTAVVKAKHVLMTRTRLKSNKTILATWHRTPNSVLQLRMTWATQRYTPTRMNPDRCFSLWGLYALRRTLWDDV